jgi:hypothetical protein
MALNFKISKTCRRILYVSLILVLAAKFVDTFLPETMALAWHVRHGFKARCCGIEIHVPLRYFASEDRDSIMLFSTPGYVRSRLSQPRYAILSLSKSLTAHSEQDVETGMARAAASFAKSGYRLVQRRTVAVAENPLQCWELYTDHSEPLGANFEVFCVGRGNELAANFTGSPSMLGEFYSTLESAQSAGR